MKLLYPQWDPPKHVQACITTAEANAATEEDYNVCIKNTDNIEYSLLNRHKIKKLCNFQQEPVWLNQTHSAHCHLYPSSADINADASVTRTSNVPLVILTADCLPILISHQQQPEIAAIHAGWRGLLSGIISNTFQTLQDSPENYMAWLGPAICQKCYAVQDDFREQFLAQLPQAHHCFVKQQQWHFSLTQMATQLLQQLGLQQIYHSNLCTFENLAFYSYRRDQGQTGRIASFIWMEDIQ